MQQPQPKQSNSLLTLRLKEGGIEHSGIYTKNGQLEKIEPSDPQVKRHYVTFKEDITTQAIGILRERIPKKIIYFNNLVLENGRECYTHRMPSHKQIFDELEKIKGETSELIEMVGNVKLWIQLNVPRIEDGNNFGVSIQEEAIQELARVEDSAFNLYDTVVKYYMTRAKLSTKIIKYPNVEDYQEAVRELDEKEWIHLKITKVDMRNNYCMLYDLLCKNWEKVVKPKNEMGATMMTF